MVPVRYVGGTSLMVVGMGMQSVFPVPVGFQRNAFPVVFGHMMTQDFIHLGLFKLWRTIAAAVRGGVLVLGGIHPFVFVTKRPHDLRKL